jgi:hypothetical protein
LRIGLRHKQARIPCALAATRAQRAMLSNIGRHVSGPAACKHIIKCGWRFCADRRVERAGTAQTAAGLPGLSRSRVPRTMAANWNLETASWHWTASPSR